MAINANEMKLLLSELPLSDSVVQDVTGHSFHSFTFSLFSKSEKAWMLYVEVGTAAQRFSKTGIMRKKEKKMQRFCQFLRANITGSRIAEVHQIPGERLFYLKCIHQGETRFLIFRFYSGPGANIIVTDENFTIQDVMMRRPQRGEEKGCHFTLPEAKESSLEKFPIREYTGSSFNEYLDRSSSSEEKESKLDSLLEKVEEKKEKEIASLHSQIKAAEERIKANKDADTIKQSAELLSAYIYLVRKGDDSVTVDDYSGNRITIALDKVLSPSENINAYYQKYKRAVRIYENALEEKAELEKQLEERTAQFDKLLEEKNIKELEKEIAQQEKNQKGLETRTGLRLVSGSFEILVGRNADENDEILRKMTRGSDIWMHTRDFPGGYVIIKTKKDKSIPLEVLLDAANLAIHYSKAKSTGKADLYYTEVKYLRRAKGGKKGLVLPTQEKNLTVTLDEKRIRRLLFGLKEE